MADTSGRTGKLNRFFKDVIAGKRRITNSADAQLFFESVRAQRSPEQCLEVIVSTPFGLEAIHGAVRADVSAAFIQDHTLRFLTYFSGPMVKALMDGAVLQQILITIAQPTTLWNAMKQLFTTHSLSDGALHSFAWLVFELLILPSKSGIDILGDVREILEDGSLLGAAALETRQLGYKIQKAFDLQRSSCSAAQQPYTAGGRHDNDFANFREIAIYPTADEFLATETPFYRTAEEVKETDVSERAGLHLENQFRLLREDMLHEIRDDLRIATGRKQGRSQALKLGKLVVVGINAGNAMKAKRPSLAVRCRSGLESLTKLRGDARRKFLADHKRYLKHQSFGALCRGERIYGFAFVERDVDLLAEDDPIVLLQFTDGQTLGAALIEILSATDVQFILVDTPVFAYEPVLRGLQELKVFPLSDVLLPPMAVETAFEPHPKLQTVVSRLKSRITDVNDASSWLGDVKLDPSQRDSLVSALSQVVSIIQGPPGTGKSFIGSQAVKIIQKYSDEKILVITYTNHALDQFVEELLDAGIPGHEMVRLGSKSTPRTGPLLLFNQLGQRKRSKEAWAAINMVKAERSGLLEELDGATASIFTRSVSFKDTMEFLEFSTEDRCFYDAFLVPETKHGFTVVGKGKKKQAKMEPSHLFNCWKNGSSPGFLARDVFERSRFVWTIELTERARRLAEWRTAIVSDRIGVIGDLVGRLNHLQERLDDIDNDGRVQTIRSKRIVACTTTAAAKYNKMIRAAEPQIVIVEEAGEILESHVLTALAPSVKQLILIGDHKQLRPKVNTYSLTVEQGGGYDLNRSMFERLIMHGSRHTTLCKQHRMHPEISHYTRLLTYPSLVDAPKTSDRPYINGLRDRVMFVAHDKPEVAVRQLADRRDPNTASSKQNDFEAGMVLKTVRYLAQQGYGTDKMVVLTPYLGQLRLLRDMLSEENDPVLNDIDASDLMRAGLMTIAESKVDRRPLRLSTIDNFQGEESDIVIACLTRSNDRGEIGFMAQPERLNVLLSRARCCMIMFGNMETFISSRKGQGIWGSFFSLLKEGQHLYDGLPVRCERHPDRVALAQTPEDFAKYCPDGGCTEACGVLMSCGLHQCQLRCHRIADHSRVKCNILTEAICDRQHKVSVRCSQKKDRCQRCVAEDAAIERQIKRDLKLEAERQTRQAAYERDLQEIEDELQHERRRIKYMTETEDQQKLLEKQRATTKALRQSAQKMEEMKKAKEKDSSGAVKKQQVDSNIDPDLLGEASREWNQLKQTEGAQSEPLDHLMGMIGLETVKQEFLNVKERVDTTLRQHASLASERFSCALLGNPGTGKTTVARLYASFLSSVGVLPGQCFSEVTGSALAHAGLSGCRKQLDAILNDGGGVLFIDEAYQLTSGNNPGGAAVLDFLLPEVENLTGKVAFVLAGYNKQMESFFAHNPGLSSRFPIEMKFEDYTDQELLHILGLKISKKYSGSMKCEDGPCGLYCRIVTRRIGRGRGREGFGNARTVENTLAKIAQRQAARLRKERRAGGVTPDDLLFTKEDLIGPEPSNTLARSEAWRDLQKMIGLQTVKDALKTLVDTVQHNYIRELNEEPPVEYSLNKLFLGNPGTGKTTVAKLYGRILVDLGLLSKGEVVVKNPADFVGAALGKSEQNTKGILAAALGKVLVVDEAYGLFSDSGVSDPYRSAVVDTIVAEVQSVPGDDRCVLLLGYEEQMENMLQSVNPGLSRRFPMSSAFTFDDFTDAELRKILDMKLEQQGFTATDEAKSVAMEVLKRTRNRPNFGNAGEVDILLDVAKIQHQARYSRAQARSANLLDAMDFDAHFDRAERTETNVKMLFGDTIGCPDIVAQLEGYQEIVRFAKALKTDPKESVPFNFLFRGPPGTGKTTTARKMGKVFYDMGFLAKAEVIECSATDLVGQYVGQTGPKVQKLLDKALGKVLFIDEAYRLADGHFAKEAMDEIVDCTTKTRYAKKLVIILAGYDNDINRLMDSNPGLTSRFSETLDFKSLGPIDCLDLLRSTLRRQGDKLMKDSGVTLDTARLDEPEGQYYDSLLEVFAALTRQDGWANARDVQTLTRKVFNRSVKASLKDALTSKRLLVDEDAVKQELNDMFQERASRSQSSQTFDMVSRPVTQPTPAAAPQPSNRAMVKAETEVTSTTTKVRLEEPPNEQSAKLPTESDVDETSSPRSNLVAKRDDGVSDEVWEQLQRDRLAEDILDQEYRSLLKARETATEEARKKIVKRLLEEERRRQLDLNMKKKLAMLGACPAGYQWIKQSSGYRCAGGSHWMSDAQLAKA